MRRAIAWGVVMSLWLGSVGVARSADDAVDLEQACLDCHRAGQTRGEVPVIEGQRHPYLRDQLGRFRDRHRDAFPMSALAAGFDAAAIEHIARALSQRTWASVRGVPAQGDADRGRARADALDCARCHGAGYRGTGVIPRLAGQHPGYLARQIGGFGSGERYHPPTDVGAPMHALDAADARDLAAFLNAVDDSDDDAAEPDDASP